MAITELPEKFIEVHDAILFETVEKAREILQGYADNGDIYDYAVDEFNGGTAVKFEEGSQFWLVVAPRPQTKEI